MECSVEKIKMKIKIKNDNNNIINYDNNNIEMKNL